MRHLRARFGGLRSTLPRASEQSGDTSDRSSISDEPHYLDLCDAAARDDTVFSNFRRDPTYLEILEHVSEEQGRDYLSIIRRQSPELLPASLEMIKRNDLVGNPRLSTYDGVGAISPTTLRYAKVLTDLEVAFGDPTGADVVEIGVGYGGQARLIMERWNVRSYTLVDLGPVLRLSERYLSQLGVRDVWRSMPPDRLEQVPCDLLISNYAFTELARDAQDEYASAIVSGSSRAYLTCNYISDGLGIDSWSRQELEGLHPDARWSGEEPLTHVGNEYLDVGRWVRCACCCVVRSGGLGSLPTDADAGDPVTGMELRGGTVAIIFSKDRPLQLDATIRSLRLHCPEIEQARISTLYFASSPAFESAYSVLKVQHPDVEFIQESDFKADLCAIVADAGSIFFLVDDVLVVGPLPLARGIAELAAQPDLIGFSFRLGRNTTYCYTKDKPQALPEFEDPGSDALYFDWTSAELDFGYPIEVSTSVYRASDIGPLLRDLPYSNPNTLETELSAQVGTFSGSKPRLACLPQSVAVSVPVNLVQTAWDNRVGSDDDLGAGALLDRYLRGERLDIEPYSGVVPNACHQELDFAYITDETVPTVSVVTRCYNQAVYLPDAVASLDAQAFDDWELVIVPDGSPDDTERVARELISSLPGRRIRVVGGRNSGLSGAMNCGVEACLGRYVLPLDADDEIAPEMLARTVDLLESRPEVAVVYTDVQEFGDSDEIIKARDFDRSLLPEQNHLSYCSLYRREVWEAVGGYNPNMEWGREDWDFWVGALEQGFGFERLPEPLFRYRRRSGSQYSTTVEHAAELESILRGNHPSLFTPTRRMSRSVRRTLRSVGRRLMAR